MKKHWWIWLLLAMGVSLLFLYYANEYLNKYAPYDLSQYDI